MANNKKYAMKKEQLKIRTWKERKRRYRKQLKERKEEIRGKEEEVIEMPGSRIRSRRVDLPARIAAPA